MQHFGIVLASKKRQESADLKLQLSRKCPVSCHPGSSHAGAECMCSAECISSAGCISSFVYLKFRLQGAQAPCNFNKLHLGSGRL